MTRVVFVGFFLFFFPVTALWHPRHWLVASHLRQGYYLSNAEHICEQLSPPLHMHLNFHESRSRHRSLKYIDESL